MTLPEAAATNSRFNRITGSIASSKKKEPPCDLHFKAAFGVNHGEIEEKSFHQNQLLGSYKAASVYLVKINAACKPGSVEYYVVHSCRLFRINKRCYLFTQNVEHFKHNLT